VDKVAPRVGKDLPKADGLGQGDDFGLPDGGDGDVGGPAFYVVAAFDAAHLGVVVEAAVARCDDDGLAPSVAELLELMEKLGLKPDDVAAGAGEFGEAEVGREGDVVEAFTD